MNPESACGQSLAEQKKAMTLEKYKEVASTSSMLAHELRNPLGVIRIALYNLKRKDHDPALDRHIEVIERKVGESERVIEELVGYTRFREPQLAPVSVEALLEQAAARAESASPEPQARLMRDFGGVGGDARMLADQDQLMLMLAQVLRNAFEAMEGRLGEIRFSATLEQGELVIVVQDQGVGIDPDDLEQIFRPFWTKKSKRDGLGLSLARRICELHAGSIAAESHKGQGSTFTIRLPVHEAHHASA